MILKRREVQGTKLHTQHLWDLLILKVYTISSVAIKESHIFGVLSLGKTTSKHPKFLWKANLQEKKNMRGGGEDQVLQEFQPNLNNLNSKLDVYNLSIYGLPEKLKFL